ncbi:MAG: PQQ-binding-like beta-propeller repeat protein [Spirochaetia bacterium]
MKAINIDNKKELWEKELYHHESMISFLRHDLKYNNNIIYLSTDNLISPGCIHAININNGNTVFLRKYKDSVNFAGIVNNILMYELGCSTFVRPTLFAAQSLTGKVIWHFKGEYGNSTMIPYKNSFYFSNGDARPNVSTFYEINIKNGSVKWKKKCNSAINIPLLQNNNLIYYDNNYLYSLNLDTKKYNWKIFLNGFICAHMVDNAINNKNGEILSIKYTNIRLFKYYFENKYLFGVDKNQLFKIDITQ